MKKITRCKIIAILIVIYFCIACGPSKQEMLNDQLIKAAKTGKLDQINALIQQGAQAGSRDVTGVTPLMWASYNGNKDIVEALLKAGANVNAKTIGDNTALKNAAMMGRTEVVKILIKAGAPATSIENRESIFWASMRGYTDTVHILLLAGADKNIRDEFGNTPLMAAAQKGRIETVQLLIKNGANLNAVNKKGWNAYLWAFEMGHPDIAKILRTAGAEAGAIALDGLFKAAQTGDIKRINLYIESAMNLNAKNSESKTALGIAKEKGFTDIVDALLKAGAEK